MADTAPEPTTATAAATASSAEPTTTAAATATETPAAASTTTTTASNEGESSAKEQSGAAAAGDEETTAGEESELARRVRRQVEFYFSDANFRRDKFLRTKAEADPQGFVDIAVLLTFNRLKELTTEPSRVADALEKSEKLQLSSDRLKVRRTKPLPLEDDSKQRTVYVKGPFPEDAKLDDLITFFEQHGPIERVQMRKTRGRDKIFKGSCFVEFSTQEAAESFVKKAQEGEIKHNDAKLERVVMQSDYFEQKNKEREERKAARTSEKEGSIPEFKRDMVPRAILKVANVPESMEWLKLQELVKKAGDVKYTELNPETRVAHIRCATSEDCAQAKDAFDNAARAAKGEEVSDLKFTAADFEGTLPDVQILEGDEEQEYWNKVWDQQQQKLRQNKRQRSGPGGGHGGKRRRTD